MRTCLVRLGNVLVVFLRFPSERQPRSCSSRKPLKNQRRKPLKNVPCHDGNHKKTNDGNHKKTFLATTETIKKRSLATTETIRKRSLPRRTETNLKHPKSGQLLETFENSGSSCDGRIH